MPNEPIRRSEFDLYREDVNRRLARLEEAQKELDEEHDTDMKQLVKDKREGRRWTWQQTVATIGAAAVVAGLWLQAAGR